MPGADPGVLRMLERAHDEATACLNAFDLRCCERLLPLVVPADHILPLLQNGQTCDAKSVNYRNLVVEGIACKASMPYGHSSTSSLVPLAVQDARRLPLAWLPRSQTRMHAQPYPMHEHQQRVAHVLLGSARRSCQAGI